MTSNARPAGAGQVVALRERLPGHAVIHALCTEPGSIRPRGRLARFFGVRPLSRDGHVWYLGALGEMTVGRLLSRLGSEWVVLHAIPVGRQGADIDHVVVGPAGVFTVNTKHHSGKQVWVADRTLMVSGSRQDHIRNAEFEGRRTAKLLSRALGSPVTVRPVIAVVNSQKLTIRKPPVGVDVVEARRLVRFLEQQPVIFGPEELAQIVSLIGEPATWEYKLDVSADLDRRPEFDAIHATIHAARRVRIVWAFAMVAAFAAGIVLAAPALFRLLTSA
jgi:hypothetical protein